MNFYAVRRKLPEFAEITQNNGHYAVQGHSRSPILLIYDFLLVINTNLPPILHHFRDVPQGNLLAWYGKQELIRR